MASSSPKPRLLLALLASMSPAALSQSMTMGGRPSPLAFMGKGRRKSMDVDAIMKARDREEEEDDSVGGLAGALCGWVGCVLGGRVIQGRVA